jgi:hypothetical protein
MMPYDVPRLSVPSYELSRDIRTDPMCPGIRAGKGERRCTKIMETVNFRRTKLHAPLPPSPYVN